LLARAGPGGASPIAYIGFFRPKRWRRIRRGSEDLPANRAPRESPRPDLLHSDWRSLPAFGRKPALPSGFWRGFAPALRSSTFRRCHPPPICSVRRVNPIVPLGVDRFVTIRYFADLYRAYGHHTRRINLTPAARAVPACAGRPDRPTIPATGQNAFFDPKDPLHAEKICVKY